MKASVSHHFVAALLLLTAGLSPGNAQFGLDKLIPKKPELPRIPSVPTRTPEHVSPSEIVSAVEDIKEVVKGAGGVSIEDEMVIGATVATEIIAQNGGLVKDEAMNRKVTLIGKVLGLYSGRPDLPWRFGILNTDAINGVSAPGGYVFITRGLYNAVQSDDELAGVLAHEISHVVRRHALRIVSRGQMAKGLMSIGTLATAKSGGPDLRAYDDGIHEVTSVLLEKGYDPGVEFDADRAGQQLAWEAGYAPDGLTVFLKHLYAKNPDKSYTFSHHPPLKHRITRLTSVE